MNINDISESVEKISLDYTKEFKIKRTSDWFILKLQEELGELTQSYLMKSGQARKKDKTIEELDQSFRDEIADVFCHVLLLAKHHKIDLEKEVQRKWLSWSK